jgi:uridylate kinase
VAVQVALEVFQASVFNVSDTQGVHPKKRNGELNYQIIIPSLTWKEYRTMIPKRFTSGMHVPFDPHASQLAEENQMTAILIGGKNPKEIFANIRQCLSGENFVGTVIRP